MTQQMKCAKEIAKWLAKNEMTNDTSIYVDHARYHISKDGELVYDIDAEPKEYFDFAGDFLSISTEGEFYDVLNYGFEFEGYEELEQEFCDIIKKYGKYYELGNAWNLSLYDC